MIADAPRVLDTDDLVQLDGDQVVIAYPFASARTPFVVRLQSGADRYACCAIDALGIAPMLGEPVRVLSGCHHCRESLTFEVGPDGPEPDAEGVMAWVETRREGERRIATAL
jgi:hypothetical protein